MVSHLRKMARLNRAGAIWAMTRRAISPLSTASDPGSKRDHGVLQYRSCGTLQRRFASRFGIRTNLVPAFARERPRYLVGALDQQPQGWVGSPPLERDDSDRPHLNRHVDRQNFQRQPFGAE